MIILALNREGSFIGRFARMMTRADISFVSDATGSCASAFFSKEPGRYPD